MKNLLIAEPAASASLPDPQHTGAEPGRGPASKKILVVEDDKKIAAALALRLAAAGYQVFSANDGLEAVKQALAGRPDLIVMDIWMPVGLGFSVAQRLKELGLGNIPVIFMTASKLKRLKRIAERFGAAAFIEKPYQPKELLSAVAAALHPNWLQNRLHSPELVSLKEELQIADPSPA